MLVLSTAALYPMFDDIIGLDEEIEELKLLIEMLQKPTQYKEIGISLPKGILLHGKPGNGKTLLARALVNELSLPVHLVTTANVEQKVAENGFKENLESIFDKAAENTPSIIFFDEFDSFLGCDQFGDVDKDRLNQTLTLLDGFKQYDDIIIMAATNNFDALPAAMIRSGRFDKKYHFSKPNQASRVKAINLYCSNITFDQSDTVESVGYIMEGLSIADIKQVCNDAMIKMIKHNKKTLNEADFTDAVDRLTLGIWKMNEDRDDETLLKIAIHETAHAMVHQVVGGKNKFVRLSITKHEQIQGFFRKALLVKNHATKKDIMNEITIGLAGYAAEKVFYGDVSLGSSSDLRTASDMARKMVEHYGMSDLGPVSFAINNEGYPVDKLSETTKGLMDEQIKQIMHTCEQRAMNIVLEHQKTIELIAKELKERKLMSKNEFEHLLNQEAITT